MLSKLEEDADSIRGNVSMLMVSWLSSGFAGAFCKKQRVGEKNGKKEEMS